MKFQPLRKMTPDGVESAVKMYEDGMSNGAIAAYFGISRNAMYDLLKRRTEMRPQLRFGTDNHFHRGGKSKDDKAQNAVEYALRKGILYRKDKCEACGGGGTFKDGRSGIQAHHSDYNKPLDVMWLCQKCHHEWHKNNKPIQEEG